MAVTVKIEYNRLIITADLESPTPSASRKTLVVASTRGNKETNVMIDGKPVIIGLNATKHTSCSLFKKISHARIAQCHRNNQ